MKVGWIFSFMTLAAIVLGGLLIASNLSGQSGDNGSGGLTARQVAPAEPREQRLPSPVLAYSGHGFSAEAFATISLDGLVLSGAHYINDRLAPIAPVDIVLGWGPMSNQAMFTNIWVSQSGRFYLWRSRGSGPITAEDVIDHSMNMHMIPSGEAVRSALLTLRKGDIVRLSGSVVDIRGPDGYTLQSARDREDRRAGASKAILVESIEVVGYMDPE